MGWFTLAEKFCRFMGFVVPAAARPDINVGAIRANPPEGGWFVGGAVPFGACPCGPNPAEKDIKGQKLIPAG